MPQVDAQIDRQRGPLVGRQMLDGNKRTFEMLNRNAVCCTGDFPHCCDLEMNDRPVPRLGANGVEGQPVGFFDQPIGIYLLTGNEGGGMERAAPVRRQHPVSCVVNEPVLEPVLDVRKQVCLVEEFGILEALQRLAQPIRAQVCHRLQDAERHFIANDGRGLQQALVNER